jgi:hypothetical protein
MNDNEERPFLATEDALEILKKLKKFMGEWMVKNPHITQIEDKLTHDFLFSVLEKLIADGHVLDGGFISEYINANEWEIGVDLNNDASVVIVYNAPTQIEALSRSLLDAINFIQEKKDDKGPS